jgi:polar amino acid transport system substrate-binding protein
MAACGGGEPSATGATTSSRSLDSAQLPNAMCRVGSLDPSEADSVDDAALAQLAPTGVLRAGINAGNVNNARLDPATKTLAGVAVDLACGLAARLAVPLVFTGNVAGTPGYATVPAQTAAFLSGAFDVGFSADPILRNIGTIGAHAHIWVENHFLVPAGSPFVEGSLAELDQPGVRIAVGAGNSADVYLKGQCADATVPCPGLQHATVVDTDAGGSPLSPAQALKLLSDGKADAFAGALTTELPLAGTGNFRILPSVFLEVHLGMFISPGKPEAQHDLDVFVEWAKRKGFIADAIAAAGLVGVQVPPDEKVCGVGQAACTTSPSGCCQQ